MKFCAEIIYEDTEKGNVQSDICWNCSPRTEDKAITEEYRQLLHDCLDEWLNKSNGTGAFWVGDPLYFSNWGE